MPKAQTVDITLKSVRAKLKPKAGNAPYFRRVREGDYIGYRPSKVVAGSGSWIARYRLESGEHKTEKLGEFEEWGDALAAAAKYFDGAHRGVFDTRKLTVSDACSRYVTKLKKEHRLATAADAEARFARLVDGTTFGKRKLATLQPEDMREWFGDLLQARLDAGAEPGAAKQSCNRNLNGLKAALNQAWRDKKVVDDHAWRDVKPHVGVNRQRVDSYLEKRDRKKLILEGCLSRDLGKFLTFLAKTGIRPGAAAALKAKHWNAPNLTIPVDKSHAGRVIVPGKSTCDLLDGWCMGLQQEDYIFTRPGRASRHDSLATLRKPFDKDYWTGMVERAAKRAGVTATVYSLRHSFITDCVRDGIPIAAVAAITGTSIAMIEKHYSHLASRTHELLDAIGF